MKRREALSTVSLLVGGALVGSQVVLYSCKPHPKMTSGLLNEEQIALLDEVGETILPATPSSPGAKAAAVGNYMNAIVTDCFSPDEQKIFIEGTAKLDEAAREKFGNGFMDLDAGEKHGLLVDLEKESRGLPEGSARHYYSMFKQLSVSGYFSSEPGATQALSHVAVPGRYEACIPLKEGQKAWG